MATFDFTTASAGVDDLQAQITNAVKGLRQSQNLASSAQSTLAGLPASSQAMRDYIDTQATANPGDDDWQRLKGAKDKMVTDFQARKATADSMVTSLNNYNP